ncbi:DUF1064 domain-containing protein [Limosilactobacillus caecicola]|uniref:DUF1064 domain-containing protein n=1 Tax=Limosilactobacillus caecicola TaxID=2941332 RepID=UPI00203D739D|nr:DUF1064 domain-containing protein [Limosilactobacillus caecicola]
MTYTNRKVKMDGYRLDSKKEARFYQSFIKPSGQRFEVHQPFKLVEKFPLGGYNQSGVTYTPDFVTIDDDGNITHVYDVKTSLSPLGIDNGAKVRFKWFQAHYRLPIEIVVPRTNDFKMTLYGFTVKTMLDRHVKHKRDGSIKVNKKGNPMYDYYNVYKNINYDIREIVGW